MASSKRSDIHRPSAPEFDPEAYQCVGVFDLHPEWGDGGYKMRVVNAQVQRGYRFTSPHGSGQCGHCGAHIRYAALMLHEASMGMIWVGETCLDNRFEALTKGEFQALRKAAALNREQMAKAERIEALCAEFPVLAWLTYGEALSGEFTSDLAYRFARDGRLSERQIAAVGPALARDAEREDARLAREAAAAALAASGVRVPAGRVLVEGEVVSTRVQEGYYGVEYKMLVASPEGWKVWGTIPAAIGNVERGDRVRFTATVEASADDPLFGFYKRPTKAEVVSPVS